MNNYQAIKLSDNIFYNYKIVDIDEGNECAVCFAYNLEDALLIAKALNHYSEYWEKE